MKTATISAALAAVTVCLAAAACGGSSGTRDAARTTTTTTDSPATTVLERPTEPVDQLVTISAGRMHVRCTGRGDTTVLLLSGWDNGSEAWIAVEPTIAETTRVCVYDRFGTGASDEPATTQTFETQVADLHELLDTAAEPGPYVVVGHSFGGAEAVTFASTYPDEVLGLGLVDASPTSWPDTVCSVPGYAGGCDLMHNPTDGERLDVFPAFDDVAAIRSLGDLPMTVVTDLHRDDQGLAEHERTRLDAIWAAGTARWAELSTRSTVVTVEDTSHDIQLDQPAIVIDEVTKLIP